MYDKKFISLTSHLLYPSPSVTNCHTFSDPLPSSVTYFMDGPQAMSRPTTSKRKCHKRGSSETQHVRSSVEKSFGSRQIRSFLINQLIYFKLEIIHALHAKCKQNNVLTRWPGVVLMVRSFGLVNYCVPYCVAIRHRTLSSGLDH